MKRLTKLIFFAVALTVVACTSKQEKAAQPQEERESREAKALLQGFWVDGDTEEVSFRAVGDTIYYPDSVSQPTYFKIIHDSLVLETVRAKYHIVKQSANIFWFTNQNGDLIKLSKSEDPALVFAFAQDRPTTVLTYTEVVNSDSVVTYGGDRYHWYITINPTKYKVHATSYNSDGVEVDNIYYDNIIHVSVFHGAEKLFATDFRKQMYDKKIPAKFLEQSLLSNMEFKGVDGSGLHFVATLCIPDGASCYKAENVIDFGGKLTTRLIEY